VAVIVLSWLVMGNVDSYWRWILFFPLAAGLFCILEAKGKTCAVLSELGAQNLDQGVRKIKDAEIAAKLRTRGRWIVLQAVIFAVVLTFACYLIP